MAGGKGKSTGGKAGPKEASGKMQKSHSAKAGLQVRDCIPVDFMNGGNLSSSHTSPCLDHIYSQTLLLRQLFLSQISYVAS